MRIVSRISIGCMILLSEVILITTVSKPQANQPTDSAIKHEDYPFIANRVSSSSADLIYLLYEKEEIPKIVKWNQGRGENTWTIPSLRGRLLYSISQNESGRLYLAYRPQNPVASQTRMIIAEATFGSSQFSTIWQSQWLRFDKFYVNEDVRIYGLGYDERQLKKMMEKPQPAEQLVDIPILHVIDPPTQSESHFFPLSISTGDFQKIVSAIDSAILRVRASGNFFLLFNPLMMKAYGWRHLLSKTVDEYAPDGQIIRSWDVGISNDPKAFLYNVFLTKDGRILAHVKSGDDFAYKVPNQAGTIATRINDNYIIQIDYDGSQRRSSLVFSPNEQVIGYLADTEEIVILEQFTKIKPRRLTF